MTGASPEMPALVTPWQRYLARERMARDTYLEVTGAAYREHLTGPWPDRDAYSSTEHHAWNLYYQAGREAWRQYRAEAEDLAAPPMPHRIAGEAWEQVTSGTYRDPSPASGPSFVPFPERTT